LTRPAAAAEGARIDRITRNCEFRANKTSGNERETDLGEMMVSGQDFAQLELAHDNKAGAVGEGKIFVVVTKE
jgi:hypothetical protein